MHCYFCHRLQHQWSFPFLYNISSLHILQTYCIHSMFVNFLFIALKFSNVLLSPYPRTCSFPQHQWSLISNTFVWTCHIHSLMGCDYNYVHHYWGNCEPILIQTWVQILDLPWLDLYHKMIRTTKSSLQSHLLNHVFGVHQNLKERAETTAWVSILAR